MAYRSFSNYYLIPVLRSCLIVFVTAGTLYAQSNPQLTFDRGNDLYQSGDYLEALAVYRQLEHDEQVSGPLFLNMGLSYIQLDSLGKAKYYLLKASAYNSTRERSQSAIEYVDSNLSRQSAILPKLPWEKAIDWILNTISTGTLLGLGIIFLNIGVIAYVITWFVKYYPKYFKIGGLISVGAAILIILLSFYVHYVDDRYSKAVMVHQKAIVTEAPYSDAAVINQAYEGYTLTIDHFKSRPYPGWSYVRMSNGMYGWIQSSEIMVL